MANPIKYNDPQAAFEKAIEDKRLSASPLDWNYAQNYMYMGTLSNGEDMFKHIATRRYLGEGNKEIASYEQAAKL